MGFKKHPYPSTIQVLLEQLRALNASSKRSIRVIEIANKLISGAYKYELMRTDMVLKNSVYNKTSEGDILRDFGEATEYTADHVMGAPWADDPKTLLKEGEEWNKGRRQSITGHRYNLDDQGRPVNPYLATGIKGRGVIGLFGPNLAVDVGILKVQPDENGDDRLYAYGIMKGETPAFCGGFVEAEQENGTIVSDKAVWHANQSKEFFEEMISNSVELMPHWEEDAEAEYQERLEQRIKARGGKPLSEKEQNILRSQIFTEARYKIVKAHDREFFAKLSVLFNDSVEAYRGPVLTSSRNTDTAWMETYLSWIEMTDDKWNDLVGRRIFDYQLSAGDDADDVRLHKIDSWLMDHATGTHSAMFACMAASFIVNKALRGENLSHSVLHQLEDLATYLNQDIIVLRRNCAQGQAPNL